MEHYKSPEDIVADIEAAISYHTKSISALRAMLQAHKTHNNTVIFPSSGFNSSAVVVSTVKSNTAASLTHEKTGFIEIVMGILSKKNAPMQTRDLMYEYTKITGREYARKDFSSRLSIEAKQKERVKNTVITDKSNNKKFLWGLNEWFVKDKVLKSEYLVKIKSLSQTIS